MKKLTMLSILLISLAFVIPTQVSATTNDGVKPGSFFYFFDTAFEKISLFFTFNPERKVQKALEYADERLAEAEESARGNDTKAIEVSKKEQEKATKQITGLKAEVEKLKNEVVRLFDEIRTFFKLN